MAEDRLLQKVPFEPHDIKLILVVLMRDQVRIDRRKNEKFAVGADAGEVQIIVRRQTIRGEEFHAAFILAEIEDKALSSPFKTGSCLEFVWFDRDQRELIAVRRDLNFIALT